MSHRKTRKKNNKSYTKKQPQVKIPADQSFHFPALFRRAALAWLIAATLEYLLVPAQLRGMDSLSGLAEMSFVRLLILTGILCFTFHILPEKYHPAHVERWLIVGVFTILAVCTGFTSPARPFITALVAVAVLLVIYALLGHQQSLIPGECSDKFRPLFLSVAIGCGLGFLLFVGGWGVCRALSFGGSTYDLGIFAQMFHNMKTIGLPMTTLERGYWLSHFDVHMSPIYYLLLPFYWLIPGAHTVNLMQAVILTLAVIPLWKLCRSFGLSGLQSVLVCLVLFLAPAYSGGTSYDFHENAFLTPLILWLFYGIRKQNTVMTAIFSVLTLMVKEDAAVYVAVIALWLIIESLLDKNSKRWGLIAGCCMLAASVAWFLAAVSYLSIHGDGVMTYRYNNLMFDGSGSLLTVIKAVLLCPLKVLYECVDEEKITFILQTLGVLLFLPLLTRRFQRYILLIPYLLINLISDYSYQHSIFFQYSFGSLAFLIYLVVANLADLKGSWKRLIPLVAAILLSFNCLNKEVVPKAQLYTDRYTENQAYYTEKHEALSSIPADASVAATTYLTVPLSQREEIYDITYAEAYTVLTSDYVVIQCNDSFSLRKYAKDDSIGYNELVALLEEHGYTLEFQFYNNFVVYKK